MTDNATPTKRKPSGAAVPGAFPRPVEFPATIVANVTKTTKREIVEAAAGGSQAEIVRQRLALGKLASELEADHHLAEIERVAKLEGVEPSYVLRRFVEFAMTKKIDRERRSGRPSEITIHL